MDTKKIIALVSLLFCFLMGAAQDIIIKRDGNQLSGQVIEITESAVKYKKADNPNGPLYSISVDDVVRINYENGSSDVFVDDDQTVPATVLAGRTGKVSDTDLYKMHRWQDNPFKVPNQIRKWGFIGGGTLVAAGALMMIIATDNDGSGGIPDAFLIGVGCAGAGVVTMATCYFISQHKRAQIKNQLYSAQLFRSDIFKNNAMALSAGVNVMADRDRTRTLGLGLTFRF